ncbi:alcohol dehydrogenase catalytic domain-containing protein [candidate division KSB1 bacterium]|nr:alcohol dehydrogenase catalytic domain-containing protein [candidate division KSB1 bacterium]
MLAAFYTEPRKIEIRTISQPVTPDDGLMIKVKACAVCGSDVRRWREGPPSHEPLIPGHEIAGQVVEVGRYIKAYKVGDRLAIGPDVHCGSCFFCQRGLVNLCDQLVLYGITPGFHGGFAEFMVLPNDLQKRGIIHHIPDGLSFQAAALAEPCSSVIACHQVNGTTLGETVVVQGAGPIGCLHTIFAQAHGARVIVSEPNPDRRHMITQFNPMAIVDPINQDMPAIVRQYTKNVGADKVICANPVAATQQQAIDVVRKGGKVILFGGLPKANPWTTLDANKIHYGQIEVIGSFSYHPIHHALALDYLARAIFPADKIITAEFGLHETQKAFELADSGQAIKVIVTMA